MGKSGFFGVSSHHFIGVSEVPSFSVSLPVPLRVNFFVEHLFDGGEQGCVLALGFPGRFRSSLFLFLFYTVLPLINGMICDRML